MFGKIWGDANNAELMQLPSGSLYLVRPGSSIKGSRECIYQDAVATIRRTTTEHNYQLVITRAYQEGEEGLLDGDEENDDDERCFLIDEELQFRASSTIAEPEADASGSAAGAGKSGAEAVTPTFLWKDVANQSGDEDDLLEFVVDAKTVNPVTRSVFEVTFLQCVFERKYGRSHEDATDEDLEKLKYK